MLAQGPNEERGLEGSRRIGKPGLNFFMFNGLENFEKHKDVFSMGVPWTMARSILYFEVLGTYLCFVLHCDWWKYGSCALKITGSFEQPINTGNFSNIIRGLLLNVIEEKGVVNFRYKILGCR